MNTTTCNRTITFDQAVSLQQFGQGLSVVGTMLLIPLLLIKLIVPKFRAFPSRLSTLFVISNLGLNLTILAGINQDWPSMWLDKQNHVPSTQFCKIQGALFQLFASAEVLLWLEITITMWFVLVSECFFLKKMLYFRGAYTSIP